VRGSEPNSAEHSRTIPEERRSGQEALRGSAEMAEVLIDAPRNNFTEAEVTHDAEVRDQVRRLVEH
jgi:hypothetical protein